MKKLFTSLSFKSVLAPLVVLVFFIPVLLQGKIPIPADSLLGLYHPWRDQSYDGFNVSKFPTKNPLITDPVLQTYPWKNLVVNNLMKGELPLWNPYSFSGQPLLANIQSSPFQILNLAYSILPFKIGWALQVILPMMLASIFMYLFLRSLKITEIASAFGSLVLPFSGFFIVWFTWGTVITTAMWLPLILFCANKLIEKMNPTYFIILTFSVFQVIVSGHWQTAFYALIAFLIYLVFLLLKYKKLKNLFLIVVAIFVGFLIAAPQILPSLEYISFSNRDIDQGFTEGREDWFLPYQHLIQIVAPDFFGNPATYNYWGIWNYIEFVGYVGVLPLMLVILGFFSRNRRAPFFIFLGIISLTFALENPISRMPYTLNWPLISSMQPSRIIYLLVFSFSALAAIGLDFFLKKRFRKYMLYAPALMTTALIILVIVTKYLPSIFPEVDGLAPTNIAFRNLIAPVGLAIAGLVVFAVLLFKIPKKIIIYIIFLLTIAELFRFAYKFTPFSKISLIFPQSKLTTFLSQQEKPFRVMTTDRRILHPNVSSVYKIESSQGYDPLYLKDYAKLVSTWESETVSSEGSFNRIVTPHNYGSRISNLLNVKYVLSFDELDSPKLVKVFEKGITKVYENTEVLPRFFFVEKVVKGGHELEKLLDNNFDLKKSAVSSSFSYDGPYNETSIIIDDYSDNSIDLTVFTQVEAPLISSNVFYPGWKAYVDGKIVEIKKANFMFQSAIIPAGDHKVEFKYEPKSVYNGLRLAALGVVLTIIVSTYLWRKKFQ